MTYKRVQVTQRQSWLLTTLDQELIKKIRAYLRSNGGWCAITHLYIHAFTNHNPFDLTDIERRNETMAIGSHKRTMIKYLIMFLWKRNKVEIKCNNGLKLIKIK